MSHSRCLLAACALLFVTSTAAASPSVAVVKLKGTAQWKQEATETAKASSRRVKAADILAPVGTLAIAARASVTLRWVDGVGTEGLVIATTTCGGRAAMEISLASPAELKRQCPDAVYSQVPLELATGAESERLGRVMSGGNKIRIDQTCLDEALELVPRVARHIFSAQLSRDAMLADVTVARLAYLGRFEVAAGVGTMCHRPGIDALTGAGVVAAPPAKVATTLAHCAIATELACLAPPRAP